MSEQNEPKFLKGIVDYNYNRNIGTISHMSSQNGGSDVISFTPLYNQGLMIMLRTEKNRSMSITKYVRTGGATPGDLLAVNTFLYTYQIYSLPMSTFQKMEDGIAYPVNMTSYDENFANPKERKAVYEEYIKFLNYFRNKIIKTVNDCEHKSSHTERSNLIGRIYKVFTFAHSFDPTLGYSLDDVNIPSLEAEIHIMVTSDVINNAISNASDEDMDNTFYNDILSSIQSVKDVYDKKQFDKVMAEESER